MRIFRNLIDLRQPTAGTRPRHPGDTAVWRYGSVFKSNVSTTAPYDGAYDLFQNTFLVYDLQGAQALYLHFRDGGVSTTGTPNTRRSFNNIFFAVNPDPAGTPALTTRSRSFRRRPSRRRPTGTTTSAWETSRPSHSAR